MKVRYQADADFNEDILTGVLRRAPEVDFQTAHDARLGGLEDSKVLAIAADEGRILVTHDRKTMPRHFGELMGHKKQGKPKHLPAKLLAIRQALGVSQSEMVKYLSFKVTSARISEYERGLREPNLLVLLRYAKSVGVSVDILIDDAVELSL